MQLLRPAHRALSLLLTLAAATCWADLAIAQQVPAPQAQAALACAYNTAPPTVTPGNFALVQCDSQGNIIISNLKSATVTIGQSRLPMILPSSGSMGNNGALTLTTALDQAYPNAYFYMPAGAIASGSTAGFYYGVMSSTTAATLYNNPYTSGTPTIPATPTGFITTGPGAYTQTTGSFITAYSTTLPGGTLGINDEIQAHGNIFYINSAGAKSFELAYGSFVYGLIAPTTSVIQPFIGGFENTGVTNRQNLTSVSGMNLSTMLSTLANGTIDSTSNQTLTAALKLSTATDYVMIQSLVIQHVIGASN